MGALIRLMTTEEEEEEDGEEGSKLTDAMLEVTVTVLKLFGELGDVPLFVSTPELHEFFAIKTAPFKQSDVRVEASEAEEFEVQRLLARERVVDVGVEKYTEDGFAGVDD